MAKSRLNIPFFAMSSMLSIAAAAPALAQDNNSDIIVTARRVEERLQDVPISITVFNQQQLTTRNVVNAGDLATFTPSLSANGRFGAENTSFAIRGFVQDPGTSPSVAVYFADAVMPQDLAQVAAAPPKDIEITGMRIALEALLYLQGKRSHSLPHIGVPGRDPDTYARRDRDHRRSDRRTVAARSGGVSAAMRTMMLPSSTTIAGPVGGAGSD